MGQQGLGRLFNVVYNASGVHIPLRNATGVTFFAYLDAGTQTITLKQSINGQSEAALSIITQIHKGPGIGGGWTKVTQAAADNFNLTTDATNDCVAVYVAADQLGDAYDCVEATVGSGTCVAVIHDLLTQRAPAALASSVV